MREKKKKNKVQSEGSVTVPAVVVCCVNKKKQNICEMTFHNTPKTSFANDPNHDFVRRSGTTMCCHEDSELDHPCTWWSSIVTLILSLLIGVPCLAYGCNDVICPFQDCFPTMVLDNSTYNSHLTAASYNTKVKSRTGQCVVHTTQGFVQNNVIDICISSIDDLCRDHSLAIQRIPIVACIFIPVALITMVFLV